MYHQIADRFEELDIWKWPYKTQIDAKFRGVKIKIMSAASENITHDAILQYFRTLN